MNRGCKEVRRIERQMRDDILDRAQVLCCTCIGVGHQLLDGRRFSRVLLDEATQATEPQHAAQGRVSPAVCAWR